MLPTAIVGVLLAPLQSGLVPRGTRVEVFRRIYWVFLALGTLVGIVVIGYMLYNAYKYRDSRDRPEDDDADRPQVGELPRGGGGGKKLALSFTLSAIIVISLIAWTYGTLLYVEQNPPTQQEAGEELSVTVVGHQFYWEFVYPNGASTRNTLRVPEDVAVRITVTSADVFHNFGIPALRVKADAIPGQTTSSWFIADETGTYAAHCYEICGVGHSFMDANVIVMEPEEFDRWYANTNGTANSTANSVPA